MRCKNRLQEEGNTTMPHVRLRNSFDASQEDEGLQQVQRIISVEEVVVCTPDAMLNSVNFNR